MTCPHIRTSDEGTQWCDLAEERIRELEKAVSRVSKAFSGDSIHDKCAIGYLMDCLTDEQKASLQALEGE